eukprot:Clim_evm66s146 gene=Clim_evmTU66s146
MCTGLQSKSVQARKLTAEIAVNLIEQMGPRSLQGQYGDRTVTLVSLLAHDASVEVQHNGKKAVTALTTTSQAAEHLSKLSRKALPEKKVKSFQAFIECVALKGVGERPSDNPAALRASSSARSRSRKPSSRRFRDMSPSVSSSEGTNMECDTPNESDHTRSSTASPERLSSFRARRSSSSVVSSGDRPSGLRQDAKDQLSNIAINLQASDFRQRTDATVDLEVFIDQHAQELGSGNIRDITDAFCARLSDQNTKVSQQALQALIHMVPTLGDQVDPVMATMVPAVANDFASASYQIKQLAGDAMDLFSVHTSPVPFMSALVSTAQNGNLRVRPVAVHRIADAVKDIPKQFYLAKAVIPSAFKLLHDSQNEVKIAKAALIRSLYSRMEDALFEATGSHCEDVNKILQTTVDRGAVRPTSG